MTREAEELRKAADEAAEEGLDEENIGSFLAVAAALPAYHWENTALVWLQKKDARDVAGIRRWKKEGRSLKDNEVPIRVLWPQVKRMEESIEWDYRTVEVYDISQMTGDTVTIHRDLSDLTMHLRRQGIVIGEETEKDLVRFPDGFASQRDFLIPPAVMRDEARCTKTLLDLIVTWQMEDLRNGCRNAVEAEIVKPVEALARFLTRLHFLGEAKDIRPELIAALIADRSHEEKKQILIRMTQVFLKSLETVRTPIIDFYQTAVLNALIDPRRRESIPYLVQQVQKAAKEDTEMADACRFLYEKLLLAEDGFIEELKRKKAAEGVLYSSPPIPAERNYREFGS